MPDRGQRDVGSHGDGQRVNGLDDRPAVRFDRVLPETVALETHITNFQGVFAIGRSSGGQEWVGEVVVVRGGQRGTGGGPESENWVDVFLEIVDPILEPL